MKDISSKADIELLIKSFYSNLLNNDDMKHFFQKIDFEKHLPRMIGFWDFIIFNTPNAYVGSLMPIHEHIHQIFPIEKRHFEIWLLTFEKTVDEYFLGPNAESAKNSALQIGATMRYKIIGSETKHTFSVTKTEEKTDEK